MTFKNIERRRSRSELKPKLITTLDEKSMTGQFQKLNRDPLFMGIRENVSILTPFHTIIRHLLTCFQKNPPTFDHFAKPTIDLKKVPEYKQLTEEEVLKYKEFSKNFVFAGDQFLYINVTTIFQHF